MLHLLGATVVNRYTFMELLFIQDIPIQITRDIKVIDTQGQYDHFVAQGLPNADIVRLEGTLLIRVSSQEFNELVQLLQEVPYVSLEGITALVEDYDSIKSLFQDNFKLVKAAGGVVRKGDQILLIYRHNKWDLPKGKRNKGERSMETAVREVEEECSVKVKLLTKICTTWHTYTKKGVRVLKKTVWYAMSCLDDTYMQPQREEGIEQVAWMQEQNVEAILQGTYQSIQYIFQAYCKYCQDTVHTNFVAVNKPLEAEVC